MVIKRFFIFSAERTGMKWWGKRDISHFLSFCLTVTKKRKKRCMKIIRVYESMWKSSKYLKYFAMSLLRGRAVYKIKCFEVKRLRKEIWKYLEATKITLLSYNWIMMSNLFSFFFDLVHKMSLTKNWWMKFILLDLPACF